MLDIQSRRSLREFVVQFGLGLGIMVVLFAATAQTLVELAHAVVRVFTFYGIIDCLRAAHRRDRLGAPSLNRWDQAAAYCFFAVLVDALAKWPG